MTRFAPRGPPLQAHCHRPAKHRLRWPERDARHAVDEGECPKCPVAQAVAVTEAKGQAPVACRYSPLLPRCQASATDSQGIRHLVVLIHRQPQVSDYFT
jgi:hypothetical protein